MNRILATVCVLAIIFVTLAATCVHAERPNVLVIMVDDLGFSDIGCYGSEIDTPNLDSLASGGLRFSQFYNTAKCHSSRVSLLTGQYCIAAGDTALTHAVTSAEVLANAGYSTAMTGKWHLKEQPTDFGFQKYFGHLSGSCNYFSGDDTFRLNGEAWKVPKTGFYTTVANVDYGLQFLDEARQVDQPWYLYVAFNAPHAPLHALPEDYAKYKGKYSNGWDVTRDARIAKQKQAGVIPDSLKPSPRPEHIPAWEDLTSWQRDYEANRMSTLAAMIDRVEQEVGRLVADLKRTGEFDNTFIFFVADNGACPYDRQTPRLDVVPTNAKTSLSDSTGWSWARNSPFRYYKQNQFEGGISTPAIVHWPVGLKQTAGSVVDQPAHLIDVLPTLAEITDSKIPESWLDRDLRPVSGISLKPILDGGRIASRPPIHLLFSRDRGLRDGDWKLVSFQSKPWELYNLANDRSELTNLAEVYPERLHAMISTWEDMTKNVLHAPAKFYSEVSESTDPHLHGEWTHFDATSVDGYNRQKNKRARRSSNNSNQPPRIRARKNTTLKIVGSEIRLTFTGDDPGIAIDLRKVSLPNGPYQLAFELKSSATATGEVFVTTNPKKSLPQGNQVLFDVNGSTDWQAIHVPLATSKRLQQIRIDVSEGPGNSIIANLRILNEEGKSLMQWQSQ
ncbi:arylsulfatase [Neorhodopirellula lusitana]|uniref:arylsulfatase n=1 Tax=Neorhodopirellula lusitana TaxID=445327 RepID=UPI003850DC38